MSTAIENGALSAIENGTPRSGVTDPRGDLRSALLGGLPLVGNCMACLGRSSAGLGMRFGMKLRMESILEVGMVSHPVAVASDVDYVAMVDQPVYQGCSHDVIAKDLAPLLKAFV